jgi:hypothetical protein
MEYTQGAYNQEDEIRGMDIHMGNEGTNSNAGMILRMEIYFKM